MNRSGLLAHVEVGEATGDAGFSPHAWGRTVRPQVRRINHHRRRFRVSCSETFHHPREHPSCAPAFQRLSSALYGRVGALRITPPQPNAVDEHDAAQRQAIIHLRLAVSLGKERPQPIHLLVSQPKQALIAVSLRSLNQIAALTSMGPDPRRHPHWRGEDKLSNSHQRSAFELLDLNFQRLAISGPFLAA